MKIKVSDIPITGKAYDLELNKSSLELDMKILSPVLFQGEAFKAGEDIRLLGRIKTSIEVDCHRCLDPVPYEIDAEFELFYKPKPKHFSNEEDVNLSELGTLYYENNEIDLASAVRDTIIIEIPIHVVPSDGEKCTRCGKKINFASNKENDTNANNPFKKFFAEHSFPDSKGEKK